MVAVFFFNATPSPEIYTLSLHDALPISRRAEPDPDHRGHRHERQDHHFADDLPHLQGDGSDRKSTRLNSSHPSISYAVFCLKKKTETDDSSSPSQTAHSRRMK